MRVVTQLSSFILTLLSFILLTSCSEVLYLTVEQMLPPEFMPAKPVHSIGVINNFSKHNVIIANEDTYVFPCNADSVKEQIALNFANAEILERVVVLDSLLYPSDSITPHFLEQEEVNVLCEYLEVDMLYCLDYACITINTTTSDLGKPVNGYLCSRIYLPDTDTCSGNAILDTKSTDGWVYDNAEVRLIMPLMLRQLTEEAVKPYFLSWKERERVFYYDRLSYELREAKVYVEEGNWEAAAQQWRMLADSKLRSHRFMAAYNMALYYEMTDSLDHAIASLERATEIALKQTQKGTKTQVIDTSLAEEYHEVLVNRKKEIEKIDMYISRMH